MTGRQLPPLTWLRAFEASARHLSFTQAAHDLNLTQSAISQHVRSLEEHLGHPLFVRNPRALRLTEAGANYLPSVREAFDLLARGTQALTGGGSRHRLAVHSNLSFSVHWLAPRLRGLARLHPWLRLNLTTSAWEEGNPFGERTVEIRFGRPGDMPDQAVRLSHDRSYPVCAPTYQAGQYDLATAQLYDCAGMVSTWDTWARATNTPFERSGEVTLASTYLIGLGATLAGGGMVMCHDMLVSGLLASGTLVRPFEGHAKMTEGYFLIPPAENYATPASRAFTDWLLTEIRAGHDHGTV
ncbi:MAG: LysR family transcriptional regulator [Pseudomonadota bacterium]